MEVGIDTGGLPLLATARPPARGDDSTDMGGDAGKRMQEDEETRRIFGTPTLGTQGPAGSRVPDLDDPRRRRQRYYEDEEGDEAEAAGYAEAGDAPPDSVGPHAPVEVEMTAEEYSADPAAGAAAAAVVEARHAGRSGSGMMDALEAAESAFEAAQAGEEARAAALGRPGSHKGGGGGSAAAAAAPGLQPPDTPRKAAICEGTREKMIQAVFDSLRANARYGAEPSRDLMRHAQSVEDALFASSHSKQVYLSKVANAVRLARTAPNVADIPRIASGEPRAVAEGHTAGEAVPFVSGLTGYVVKPQM